MSRWSTRLQLCLDSTRGLHHGAIWMHSLYRVAAVHCEGINAGYVNLLKSLESRTKYNCISRSAIRSAMSKRI